MLQPRSKSDSAKMGSRNFSQFSGWLCFVLLYVNLVSCQDLNNEEILEGSRIKRENVPENRDLTVLLVNDKRNEYNTKIGRYHNVKPLIGLLTSTARTFIQDGVTTEFATQILGTTLDNGRIYAQVLTKSSLVLYNRPSNVDNTIKPTRVHSGFDGEWNVKQDLGFIDPEKFVLKNTDYIAPSSKMEIVYASKPVQDNVKYWTAPTSPDNQENQILDEPTGRRVAAYNEIPRYQHNEAFNYLDGPAIDSEKKLEFIVQPSILENVNTLHRQSKAYEQSTEQKDSRVSEDTLNESNIVKVKPNYDLPTFTIKNEFSPIFYYIDNVETRSSQHQVGQQTKQPKKLFGQKSEPRPKKTFTYAGFADFTTVVGDTVIIFTPNTETSTPQNPSEVNVFPSARQVDKKNTKITFLASDIPVATATYKAHEATTATKLTTPSSDENRSEKALFSDEESLKKVLYEVDKMPDSISVQYNNGFDFNIDVIQPSEPGLTTTESTRITEDLENIPIPDHSEATEPLTTLRPSSTLTDEPKESTVIESVNVADIFTNSEEETENTAAEVTESDEEDDETTTEMSLDIQTTTESGQSSEEPYEDIETTTESKRIVETSDQGIVCTDGFETQTTMTTAYKTLTYLTTYFIPLESTDTTTSVKSDVVVESTTGQFTNLVCRNNVAIEPTAVVSVDVKSSIRSNVEKQSSTSEDTVLKAPQAEVSTESIDKITTIAQESTKASSAAEEKTTTKAAPTISEDSEETVEETEPTTTTTSTTTTERIEVSVSTEKSTTPAEKTTPQENESSSEENEIDLIYKTLYTTYTYFTTFFGDQTSSVASHKSVVTNIITSTVDLSKLDPSLLGAFDDDEIAPTSVGIGRPTETFAINSIIDLVKNKDLIESVESNTLYSSQTPTPFLGDDITNINPDAVKTYYTTYTFFTTIYVGSDANVCSRSEVYTNYVGPESLIPTKTNLLSAESTKAQFDFRNCKQVKREPPANPEENSSVETSVSMEEKDQSGEKTVKEVTPQPSPSTPLEYDMLFSVESNPVESENSYVTDVKSSSSSGERQYLENNHVIDDQISSESNIDEIMPSPTLLLQTSYTTFTYFTTMYIGKDSSKVKSRLETITNVVTETLMPKKEIEEESNLPITYYTTFTYWTTLSKNKSTTITSHEEIVSNVVTPAVQAIPTISPIDTTPIDIESVLPPKDLEVELKPSILDDNQEQDDGKATFYTTYTYFTTFYAGNTSQIRSSLETVTNIVDNTKVVEDNQLGRKVSGGDKNIIQDDKKPDITPTVVKEEITPTKLSESASVSPTVLLGTYIDNLFAEVKPADGSSSQKPDGEKKILFSQVAVISGDSTVVTSDNKTLDSTTTTTTTTTESTTISPAPEVIESSQTEPETSAENEQEAEDEQDDDTPRKKSRLTFTTKKPSFTPVIIPFASRNRPTFSPKRVPLLSSATTITRQDFTPTITATPTLKSVRTSGFGGNRKSSAFPGSSAPGRRFSGRNGVSSSSNIPSASRSGGFVQKGSISPTSRRTGFRSSSVRGSIDISRSALPRIRPTATNRLRGGRQSASVSLPPPDQNESETTATQQQEENSTESLEEVTEAPVKTTNNPLLRFRRPPLNRLPGTAVTPRSTTETPRRTATTRGTTRGRITTTTRRTTTRTTANPLLSIRRQRPNALFPRRNLFKQPEPEPEEEIKENEQKVEDSEEILEEEEFEDDTDYDSSDRKEQQVSTPSTQAPRKANPSSVSIRPFNFRRRSKRLADNENRRHIDFRRPGATSRIRGGKQSAFVTLPPPDQDESETTAYQQQREYATESLEEVTEAPVKSTNNPRLRQRRPPLNRQPGVGVNLRSTAETPSRTSTTQGTTVVTINTATEVSTTRTNANHLLSLRRQRINALFPRSKLFKQTEPEIKEEVKETEQKVEENEETLEKEEFEDDNENDSLDIKEEQVSTQSTQAPRKANPSAISIRPSALRRRSKRQTENHKYANIRGPGARATSSQPDSDYNEETKAPVTQRTRTRLSSRLKNTAGTTTSPETPRQTTTTQVTNPVPINTATEKTRTNPLLSLRRQKINALFPRSKLFKQGEPENKEEIKETEQKLEENEETLEKEEFEGDNENESPDIKEEQVSSPSTQAPRKANPSAISIRPSALRRRSKRQTENRKYTSIRRPGAKATSSQPESDYDEETEAPVTQRTRTRLSSRLKNTAGTTTSPETPRQTTTTQVTNPVPINTATEKTRTNPLLSLRRQKINALFPRSKLFKQGEPENKEEIKETEQKLEENEETLEKEEFEGDNENESPEIKEEQVSTPSTQAPRKGNPLAISIRPSALRRRSKRQTENHKYANIRRPGVRATTRQPESEYAEETEPSVTQRTRNRLGSRLKNTAGTTTTPETPHQTSTTRGTTVVTINTSNERTNTRTNTNYLLSLRRQKINTLFPRSKLFKQSEPEPEEEMKENEQKEDNEEIPEEEDFENENEKDAPDVKEQQVSTSSTQAPRKANPTSVSIRPSALRRRSKRQTENRKYTNIRRPGVTTSQPESDYVEETEPPVTQRTRARAGSRILNTAGIAAPLAPRNSRQRGGRQSASLLLPDQNESKTNATKQEEETAMESLEEVTEASVKTNNPLLKFKRPSLNRLPANSRSTTETPRRTTTRGTTSDVVNTTTKVTTTRTTENPLLTQRRQKLNSLLPKRNLFKKPEPEPVEEIKENEQKVEDNEKIPEKEDFDDEYDDDSQDVKEQQISTPSTQAPRKINPSSVVIRPLAVRRRSKRQADYGIRKYTNFRRPGAKATTRQPEPEYVEETEPPVTQRTRTRFNSRLSNTARATTPSSPRTSARQPFIIRGESKATTTSAPAYRRNGKTRVNSRTTTNSSRPKSPRLVNDRSKTSSARSPGRSRTRTTTSRATSRQRNSFENTSGERFNKYDNILNDGKFTVTHHIPTEVTIPVVNGKITEYKSVISATPKVETLLANQVSTSIGPIGPQLVLVSEATDIAENGATKLIKFLLHETSTTTVIFTPTTIRGRKTSYSHILPSTVYNVEPVTQTIAPEINANVPLANLLLSQLLLGNQQPGINPLLALQGQGLVPQPQTPITEYKTRTTTYVTTVTDARETVLTITFRATPIETTIKDPTTNVITATEYITDTVVTTPTAFGPAGGQINSLLLPLLLQQQQQQQSALSLQTPNPLLGLGAQGLPSGLGASGLGAPDLALLQNNNLGQNDVYSNSPKPNILSDLVGNEDYVEEIRDDTEDAPPPPPPPPKQKGNKPKAPKPPPPKLTSVVTLYVSGRHPGEFSTVLSTVVTDDTQTVRKREAMYYEDVKIQPSVLPSVNELVGSQSDNSESELTGIERFSDDSIDNQVGTQSLESIVGEISKHIRYDASPTYVVKLASPSAVRYIKKSVDDVS